MALTDFQCKHEGCGKWFSKQKSLNRHKKSHSFTEKSYKCHYEGCKDAYYRKQHLQRHINRIHSTAVKGDFTCSEEGCIASFETQLSLRNHSRIKHNDPTLKRLTCSFCPKYFYKKWQVKEHETFHTKLPAFKCSTCEEKFDTYHKFRRHEKAHKADQVRKVHTCKEENCNLTFVKWTEFLEHKKTSHTTSTCEECNQIFEKHRLKLHKKIHAETREVFQCKEEGCPKYYFFQRNLNQHVKSAHQGMCFACDLCTQKLSTKQKLSAHKKKIHKRV